MKPGLALSLLLAASLVLLLTRHPAGSDRASPAASATELTSDAAPGSTAAPGPTDTAARYLAQLSDLDTTQGYEFSSVGESALLAIGTAACDALDRGATYDDTRESVIAQVPNGGQVVLAAAATFLCPQHHGKLQDYAAKPADSADDEGSADVAVG